MEDNGVDLTAVSLSANGSMAVFVRGGAANRSGWVADPDHDPDGGDRAIWAARTTGGGGAWRLADGSAPAVSPDGKWVLYVKDGEIYRVRTARGAPVTRMDTGGIPFIREWGNNGQPRWSPDGSKISFVSSRENHSLIGVYDVKTRMVSYISPSVDCDGSPTWSPDGKQIAFIRRPGTPFGQQAQQGNGGIGNLGGPAAGAGGRGGATGECAGFGRRGGGGAAAAGRGGRGGRGGNATVRRPAGLYSATFKGGYTLSMYVYDVATGNVREFWHNDPSDRVFTTIPNIRWGDDAVVFQATVPNDEYERYYSINIAGTNATPVQLTTTNGLIEDNTAVQLSSDGKTFYYCTNAGDIERRHIWAVPTDGGTPRQVSTGERNRAVSCADRIRERNSPCCISTSAVPASVEIRSSARRMAAPESALSRYSEGLSRTAHVTPQIILTKAADGLEIHNQLFLPKDLKPGEKRPAMILVHERPEQTDAPGATTTCSSITGRTHSTSGSPIRVTS